MSVCIVHKDGWAVADSRDTIGSIIFPSTAAKVIKSDCYLISVVGAGILNQNVAKIVKAQGREIDVIEAIGEMIGSSEYEGEMLAVSHDRKLIHIDGHGLLTNLDRVDFWAIGCAESMVLGRLLYIGESRPITIDDAEAAIKAASIYDNTIDDRVQRFWLDRGLI